MDHIFVLMEEDYGGMFSSPFQPVKATPSESLAKEWVLQAGVCQRKYEKLEVEYLDNDSKSDEQGST
jgi:hypothetical protein